MHFPCGNLQTLFSRHGVFLSYCAQSYSKLILFGRHCRCLFEKTHSVLHFLLLRFAHGSFTSVGAMVVGTAVVGAAVVGTMVVRTVTSQSTTVFPGLNTVLSTHGVPVAHMDPLLP